MSGVLVIAESREGELRPVSLELIGAGSEVKEGVGGPLTVGVIAAEPDAFAVELALADVDEIVTVASPVEYFEPHIHQHVVERLIDSLEPDLVLTAMTVDGLGFAPAVAASTGCGFVGDVTGIEWDDGPAVRSSAYGGKVDVEQVATPGSLLMLREGVFPRAAGPGSPARRALDVDVPSDLIACERLELRPPEEITGVDITKAPFLLAVGRGIEDESDLADFEDLAGKIGATLAVSRPLVDAGWATSARQVGQSGRTVTPKVYLAMGISGAVQHLAGIRDADTVIAINSDPEAPIFRVAEYGAVGDMFEVADELAEKLST